MVVDVVERVQQWRILIVDSKVVMMLVAQENVFILLLLLLLLLMLATLIVMVILGASRGHDGAHGLVQLLLLLGAPILEPDLNSRRVQMGLDGDRVAIRGTGVAVLLERLFQDVELALGESGSMALPAACVRYGWLLLSLVLRRDGCTFWIRLKMVRACGDLRLAHEDATVEISGIVLGVWRRDVSPGLRSESAAALRLSWVVGHGVCRRLAALLALAGHHQ